MPSSRVHLRIDNQPEQNFALSPVGEPVESLAPPAPGYVAPPTNLTLSTGLSQSDRSTKAYIDADWIEPPTEVQGYDIQWATDEAFTQVAGGFSAGQDSTTIGGLNPLTLYYVRVRAYYRERRSDWSAVASITTPVDDTPPSLPIVSSSTIGANGDLVLVGTFPPEQNTARVEFTVRGDTVGVAYVVETIVGEPGSAFRFVWRAADNVARSGGDASLTIALRAQNWSGFFTPTSLIVTATKNLPTTPVPTITWDAALGAAVFAWTSAPFETYTLTIDGVPRPVQSPYTYDAATNRKEHAGTADPSLAWSLVATDPLNQSSAAASGTATLARPASPGSVTVTWSGSTGTAAFSWAQVANIARYELTIDGLARPVYDIRYDYELARNRNEHGGTADPSLTWSLVAVDGLGQTSEVPATGTAILARPATPTGLITEFTSANALWNWNLVTEIVSYRLTIDGTPRELTDTRYEYLFATNRSEHGGGTTAPQLLDMASLTWSLVAVDALDQTSLVPASGTLVNLPPATPTAITLISGATGFHVSITHPETRDLRDYTIRIIKDSATLETLTRTVAAFPYAAVASGSYAVGAVVNDVFGQASSELVSSATLLDPLDMTAHRSGITYSDDLGTSETAFLALRDDNRASGGITYT